MQATIGVDEVGRGAWAGPLLVVAARRRKPLPTGLKDSKILSKAKRNELSPLIAQSCDIGLAWVSNIEIDRIGLAAALRIAFLQAVNTLVPTSEDSILIDGTINYCEDVYPRSKAQVKADRDNLIVSAASVYAKVLRDEHMRQQEDAFPGYGFAQNVGYGTRQHLNSLLLLGVSDLHRRSFKPVKVLVRYGKR